jgi:molybdate transport system substrate-binding protein
MRLRRHLLAGLLALATGAACAEPLPVTVLAAASLKNALDAAAASWPAARVRAAYGASSALARQLEQGAPADLFLSADVEWMEWAATRKLVRPETRVDLLGNRLVLIAPASAARPIELHRGMDLAGALGGRRLALADPGMVPAGKYARAALESLGLWDQAKERLARAENVRAALAFVARGEAPLGIVYASDALADPSVAVVARIAPELHPPIIYPAAVAAASTNPGAGRFLAFLASPAARPIFERHGFAVLAGGS